MVDRRTYLGLLAGTMGFLTGCTTSSLRAPDSSALRTVSHARTEARQLSVEVTVTRKQITTEQTATVEIALTNSTSEPIEIHLNDGQDADPLLSHTYEDGTRTDEDIQLIPVVNADLVERASSDCWNPDEPIGGDLVPTSRELAPGESLANEYQVWGREDSTDCLPPGTYDFGNWDEGGPGSWKVTLELSAPDA